MKKVILFDLDGTLIDSTEAILESFRKSFEFFGEKEVPKEEEILSQIGHPLFDMFVNLGVSKERAQEFVNVYKDNYRKVHTLKTKLLPKAKEAVELASKEARLGVVTTKTGRYSIELMEYFGLMQYFEVLIGSEDVKNHKPHPEPILKALELMDVTYRNSVYMIGDTCMDVLSAKNAGITGVAVEFKYADKKGLKVCSKVVKSSVFEAVSDILGNII